MNAVIVPSNGVMGFGQLPTLVGKPLGKNQVLVKVAAAAINPSDILFMRGKYAMAPTYPTSPGWEGSGTIVAVGSNPMNQKVLGKRVAFMFQGSNKGMTQGAAMADYCVTSNRNIIPLSDEIDFERASSFFINPLTAIGMVERCVQLKSKATIVTAAASQIGRMIIPLLLDAGITPICTVRKEDQAQICRDLVGA